MTTRREELDALLVQRATEGLDTRDTLRLNQLLSEFPDVDPEWADRLVGEIDAASVDDAEAAVSPELRAALAAGAPPVVRAVPARGRWTSWAGWAVAAVLALLWLGDRVDGPGPGMPPGFERVAAAPGALVAEWTPGADPTGAAVSGEIAWSSEIQAGVMRFRGLAANVPDEFQYQLWIFDRDRDERYPVDGGVFDIPADGAEAEIPVTAALPVDEPTLFAVTVEPPGGVVVSSRERIATVAQVTLASD